MSLAPGHTTSTNACRLVFNLTVLVNSACCLIEVPKLSLAKKKVPKLRKREENLAFYILIEVVENGHMECM